MHGYRRTAPLPPVAPDGSAPSDPAVSASQVENGSNSPRKRQDCSGTSVSSPDEAEETSLSCSCSSSPSASSFFSTSSTSVAGDREGEGGGVSSDPRHHHRRRSDPRMSPGTTTPCCGAGILAETLPLSPCSNRTSFVPRSEEDPLAPAAIQFELSREGRMAAALMTMNRERSGNRANHGPLPPPTDEMSEHTFEAKSHLQARDSSFRSSCSGSPASSDSPSSPQKAAAFPCSRRTETEDSPLLSSSTAGVEEEEEDIEHLILRARDLAFRLAPQHLGIARPGGASRQTSQECLSAAFVTMGSTNRMVRVWNRSDPRKACAVKFFGQNTGQYISREKEMRVLRLLAANHMGKKILATFEESGGGLIEAWLVGSALEPVEMLEEAPSIARELARLHTIDISEHFPSRASGSSCQASSGSSFSSRDGPEGRKEALGGRQEEEEESSSERTQSDLWVTTWKLFELCRQHQEGARKFLHSGLEEGSCARGPDGSSLTPFFRRILMFDLRAIEELLHALQALALEVDSPTVLCHGDLLSGNIIRTDEGKIVFIDFEYAGFMERGFDIANHFAEHAGIECDYSKCPDEARQNAFLREYLREARRLRTRSHGDQRHRQKSAESSSSSPLDKTSDDCGALRPTAAGRQKENTKQAGDAEGEETGRRCVRRDEGKRNSSRGQRERGRQVQRDEEEDEDFARELMSLRREVQVFFSVSHIMWGLWALVQAVNVLPREYSFWRFAFDRLAAAVSPPIPSLSPPRLGSGQRARSPHSHIAEDKEGKAGRDRYRTPERQRRRSLNTQ